MKISDIKHTKRMIDHKIRGQAGFFDDYQEFFKTSKTSAWPNRLNSRYVGLIENNQNKIKNKKILDIASHDGRWSFAALKIGAKHVLGIEGREHLVKNSVHNMKKYGIEDDRFKFIVGDIHEEITKISPGSIDTVFCFGFFYHTMHHMYLLAQIKRIKPKFFILDTGVSTMDSPVIELFKEPTEPESGALRTSMFNNKTALIGLPTKSALEMMLNNMGFKHHFYDWKKKNWKGINDYLNGRRVTAIAEL